MNEVFEALKLGFVLILAVGAICAIGAVLLLLLNTALVGVFVAASITILIVMFIVGLLNHYETQYEAKKHLR